MVSALLTCPACRTPLRLPQATPEGRVRCPRCKEVFAPIVDAEVDESESVAVVVDEPHDPDRSFFERLADADDPFSPPKPPDPIAEAEHVAEPKPEPAKPVKRPREQERATPTGNGFAVALVALIGFVLLSGFACASYVAYRLLSKDGAPESAGSNPESPDARIPDAALAKVKAATVHVRTHYPDGQTTASGGFFVPGPGLVLTNARSIGQGKKITPATKIIVTCGMRALAAHILDADAELDLALLQVASFDLPEPLPLTADTFTVREPMPVVVFSTSSESDAKNPAATNVKVTGTQNVSGTRPWFVLGGPLPHGGWGGPVTDASGKVVGVAGVIAGSDTVAAVPAETALGFVQKAVKAAEASGGIPFASADSGKKKPRDDIDDSHGPGMPNPWGQGMRPPIFPPGFDRPPGLPPGWNQPVFPQPDFPRPRR